MQVAMREVKYRPLSPGNCYLIGDIGGTNANFGIFLNDQYPPVLLLSLHIKSKEINNFAGTVAEVVDYLKTNHGITIVRACFGAAGVLDMHHVHAKPTNLGFVIDLNDIKSKTGIEPLILINDFQAVGFGIGYMAEKDLVVVQSAHARINANRAAVGAGTGLGKCIMAYQSDRHPLVLSSEGGHGDFAAQDEFDLTFLNFIRRGRDAQGRTIANSWEDVLSGAGIMSLYKFFGECRNYQHTAIADQIKQDFGPDIIFKFWQQDQQCRDTFVQYAIYYARCAKSFALDALALGGLYIAGGIAANNVAMFQLPEFINEFVNCRKQGPLLRTVPITVVADYNVSLYGGAHFLLLFTGGFPQKGV